MTKTLSTRQLKGYVGDTLLFPNPAGDPLFKEGILGKYPDGRFRAEFGDPRVENYPLEKGMVVKVSVGRGLWDLRRIKL